MINVTVDAPDRPTRAFPKLMATQQGTVVLFHALQCGICLRHYSGNITSGSLSTTWEMSQFTDFEGAITLRNE